MRKKALVYRRGGLGDTLLAFPVLEILKKKGFHVTAVGNTDYFALAGSIGWADVVLSEIPEGTDDFDRKVIIGIDGNVKPFPEVRKWVVQHYLESLGFEGHTYSKKLPIESEWKTRKAFLHPSSGSKLKNAPLDVFIRTEKYLQERGFEVFWLIGEAEEELKGKFHREIYVRNITDLAKEMSGGIILIGNDSGFAHLAAYVGLHTLVIYGPTDPVIWKPVGEWVYQLYPEIECAPCFPNVCQTMDCLNSSYILERLFPLLDHILVKINEDHSL